MPSLESESSSPPRPAVSVVLATISRTIASLERYLALSAARAARALVTTGRLREGARHGWAALGSVAIAGKYMIRHPARKAIQ